MKKKAFGFGKKKPPKVSASSQQMDDSSAYQGGDKPPGKYTLEEAKKESGKSIFAEARKQLEKMTRQVK